ncbi:single-stranded DNA-binding protein [Citricoccus sp. NR2]|uniref:single-stranded DNA-binding protein n=1 Tax=Citricoccus sp. NR2 TaxID=3004095 RepID=UPI0022DD764A|nr:single-stranded DNA-binding protein [Citricoccus sp. NR2]WBL18480.1 single-stranded DNA-binding protein [Citricoccus sp. NR2]
MAQIIFTGNVGRDSELRWTKNNDPVLSFSVSESHSRKLDNGEWETLRQQWFDVSVFGPVAEALANHVLKGARVRVAGDLWRRDYESQNGPGMSLDVRAIGVDLIKPAQPRSTGGWEDPAF